MRDDDEADEREFLTLQRVAATLPPVKIKTRKPKTVDRFVKVPLWWAEQAARATNTPKAFVWLWLLHLAWKTKSDAFPLPNEQLNRHGVSRYTKRRALRELEEAGLIQVSRAGRKTPVVTLLYV